MFFAESGGHIRACLKNIKTPKQRTFFRRTALKNLEIHKARQRRQRNPVLPAPPSVSLYFWVLLSEYSRLS